MRPRSDAPTLRSDGDVRGASAPALSPPRGGGHGWGSRAELRASLRASLALLVLLLLALLVLLRQHSSSALCRAPCGADEAWACDGQRSSLRRVGWWRPPRHGGVGWQPLARCRGQAVELARGAQRGLGGGVRGAG